MTFGVHSAFVCRVSTLVFLAYSSPVVPILVSLASPACAQDGIPLWAVPTGYVGEGAESPRVINAVADATVVQGFSGLAPGLHWGGVGKGGKEVAQEGPDCVAVEGSPIGINIKVGV